MATSTVELRHLLRTNFELFDFDYRFDDLNMKNEIEQAIIDYYFFFEIGQEVPDRFKHIFKSRFLSIIDYYNDLHNTTLLKYDPLINYRMRETMDRLADVSTKSEQDFTEQSTSLSSGDSSTSNSVEEDESGNSTDLDYPQNTISGDYRSEEQKRKVERTKKDSGSGTQSSKASGNTEGLTKGNTKGNQKENYQKEIEGMTGVSYQELVRLERDNILRLKLMIIDELKPCFMLTY